MTSPWPQVYDPLGHPLLSALLAAIPVVALLASLAWFRLKAPVAAAIGLGSALVLAVALLGMPPSMALASMVLCATSTFAALLDNDVAQSMIRVSE